MSRFGFHEFTGSRRFLHRALLAATLSLFYAAAAYAASSGALPDEPLISVWEHSAKVDIAPMVEGVGFNTVWTHDKPYEEGQKLEDTLMYRHLQTPGVKYVIAKIERSIWGWTHDQSLRHAEWIANLSLTHKQIIGVYLNDFYGEMEAKEKSPEKGGRTPEQWREIIARLRAGNPRLAIWAPCYPPRELEYPFDFDIDAVIFNVYNTKQIPNAERLLLQAEKKFQGKPILTGLYLNSGSERRWLTETEFKELMGLFIRHINEGKTIGLRIFRADNLRERPEYMTWAKEMLKELKGR
ncbi:MAG: hypothetical protein HY238_13690 [Acidobacteria bacterium]|nr:hypothetical protein [Acidobacteriota bacterium]